MDRRMFSSIRLLNSNTGKGSHNHGDNCPGSTTGRNNLMAQTRCAISTADSTLLTSSQGAKMRAHCSVQDGC